MLMPLLYLAGTVLVVVFPSWPLAIGVLIAGLILHAIDEG